MESVFLRELEILLFEVWSVYLESRTPMTVMQLEVFVATPEPALVTSPHFPGKVAPPEINFEEVQDLINTLESKNDKYLDDNRLLTKNIITKSSIISKLEEQVELMKLQNRTLVEKNVELARLQKLEEQKKQRPDQKMKQRIKTLEEELESERSTLEIIKEKSEKSHNEIIQLNKGSS